jgi:hypothetical protein
MGATAVVLHPDLFVGESPIVELPAPWQPDGAHAAQPGTGPDGQTCGACDHLCEFQRGAFCMVLDSVDVVGPIGEDDPACALFEPFDDPDPEYEDEP